MPYIKKTVKSRLLCSSAAALILSQASVGTIAAAEREQEGHVHGVGHLNVAVEKQAVEIELQSPGDNIVGFEYAAETEEDRAMIAVAVAILKDGGALFVFPPDAQCRFKDADVESSPTSEGHGNHEHEAGRENHAEFHVYYKFHCDHPARLTHVDVRLFEHFPATRELVVQVVSPQGQTAGELTPSSPRLTF